jgi:microcystin-dependent protein
MTDSYTGEIRMFAGRYSPKHWAFCNGSMLSSSDRSYQALFSLIGSAYGGDGITSFALPDLRGRIPLHQGWAPGLSNRAIGQMTGAETSMVNINQMPNHKHPLCASTDATTSDNPTGRVTGKPIFNFYDDSSGTLGIKTMADEALSPAGESLPHDNVMPFLGINFIICLNGIYPPRS